MTGSGFVASWRAALAAILLAGISTTRGLAEDWSTAQTVTVVTVEYAFRPKTLTFREGVAYRLHLDNQGREQHEFTAPEFFKAIRIRDPKVVNSDLTEIVIEPGEQKDLYFVARQPGKYRLICSDHDWAGMIGDITITP
ncbi:MAG TPA: cupredoxin domain-containing protein [Stellaceae bacterium]|nr:cupredoxin domain-containing protein [Stellaceae bacterium]